MYDEALRDLLCLYRGEALANGWRGFVRKEEVSRWAEVSGMSAAAVLDRMAIGLARDFAANILTWQFCDRAANDLFHAMLELDLADEARKFWKFYLAFDLSETFPEAEAEAVAHKEIRRFLKIR